jgi:hypothetical protein
MVEICRSEPESQELGHEQDSSCRHNPGQEVGSLGVFRPEHQCQDFAPGQFGNDHTARSDAGPKKKKFAEQGTERSQVTRGTRSGETGECRLSQRDYRHVSDRDHESDGREDSDVPFSEGMLNEKCRNARIQTS